ncbi:MAG: long-chain fatty acid--CoA ligase [Thermoanaerobaculia bacterium]
MSIQTLSELFLLAAGHRKDACLMHKVDGRYVAISTEAFAADVRRLAKALADAGIRRGDRVALMADNGPHWPTIDFATLAIGAVLVPIYPTLLPEGAAYIARDSGARILFIQGRERLEGMLGVAAEMPAVEKLVLVGGAAPAGRAVDFAAFLASGAAVDASWFEMEARRAAPDDLATFIYTSGTTGDPKGVMLTHGNIISNVLASDGLLNFQKTWTALSFLPLAHSFERTIDYVYFYQGVTIAYAESVQTVAQNLMEVKPQIFGSVPRVYEKVMARVIENATAQGGLKSRIFHWAVATGRAALPKRMRFEKGGLALRLADRLVFSKVRERLGGKFAFAVSGGAPLGRDVAEFFWGAGIPILEGYGLTETSPVISVNYPAAVKLGTVGRPIPGVTVRIADDGEILARGPNIMRGYFGKPQATAEAIDSDGWFHTGDIGHLDDEGFLVITDRKKELIVNAYGKNIAPAPIENDLKVGRFVGQAVVIGDRRQFLVALIVPDFDALKSWTAAQAIGGSLEQVLADARVRALFQTEVDRVNQHLARYEQIRAFDLLPAELTLEGGELTPTMKVKRRVILSKYKDAIDRLYAGNEGGS